MVLPLVNERKVLSKEDLGILECLALFTVCLLGGLGTLNDVQGSYGRGGA